jgi:hypothetical protein
MTYVKPDLFVLTLAGNAVRDISTGNDTGGSDKKAGAAEAVHDTSDTGGMETSTTSGAYEADE